MKNMKDGGIQFKQLMVIENNNTFQYTYRVEDGI